MLICAKRISWDYLSLSGFVMLELDNLQWRTAKGEPKLDENKRETWGPTDDSYY